MPKITVTNKKGLVQSGGRGGDLVRRATTGTTSLIATGANDVEMTLTQPAGTVLVDVGFVLTTAIAGSSGNSNLKVGTSDDGNELISATALMSSATAAVVGSGISVSGLMSEGAATLAFKATSAAWTSADRTVYLRLENSAAITAGAGVGWISYMYLS